VWKWLTTTPDHDDFFKVQNDIIDLIDSKQLYIKSKLIKEIESPPEDLKKVFIDQDLPLKKHPLLFYTFDLQNLIGSITLTKRHQRNKTRTKASSYR